MKIEDVKPLLDEVIRKGRVHWYKPIQIAEVLYRDRVEGDIDLEQIETYRINSKKWRNSITNKFLGRVCSSSNDYQDALFLKAIPPENLTILGKYNKEKGGVIEKYIYDQFLDRFNQMSKILDYCKNHDVSNFVLKDLLELFRVQPGLKKSVDKIYEIVVYALFTTLVSVLEVKVTVSYNPERKELLCLFEDFSEKVICISPSQETFISDASIYRVGVTNAADRGLDMWGNFGPAIQIKHLTLDEELAESITSEIYSNRIVIVCKDSEQKTIVSLLNQIGWRSKIQSIVVESELEDWYEKALRGKFASSIGNELIEILEKEIINEFPITKNVDFNIFYNTRGYNDLNDVIWKYQPEKVELN